MNSNQINVIRPFKYHGQWVFDDPAVALEREAFVAEMDTMLDGITGDITGAGNGFICLFSSDHFPGNVHSWEEKGMEEWLCLSLGKYWDSAPENLYFQVRSGAMEAFSTNRRTTNLQNKMQAWMTALNWGI